MRAKQEIKFVITNCDLCGRKIDRSQEITHPNVSIEEMPELGLFCTSCIDGYGASLMRLVKCLKCNNRRFYRRINKFGLCPQCSDTEGNMKYKVKWAILGTLKAPFAISANLILWGFTLIVVILSDLFEWKIEEIISDEEPLYHHAGYRLMAKDNTNKI